MALCVLDVYVYGPTRGNSGPRTHERGNTLVGLRSSLLHRYGGNTAIYPAEVYTRVAAVNSRPGTGYVIVRDPIA